MESEFLNNLVSTCSREVMEGFSLLNYYFKLIIMYSI